VKSGKNRRSVLAVTLTALTIVLLGCTSVTPIMKILDNPRDYSGQQVTISGEVTQIFSLVFMKYFMVKDKTGEIVVVTKKPLPKEGTAIKVTGTVREAFSIADTQVIVIVENAGKGSE
jgi:aspartyl/asparaginyl-tRNA synthetase